MEAIRSITDSGSSIFLSLISVRAESGNNEALYLLLDAGVGFSLRTVSFRVFFFDHDDARNETGRSQNSPIWKLRAALRGSR